MPKQRRTPTRLPAQALAMFASVRVDYATASDEEWDHLREHLDTQLDRIDGGSPAQRTAIVAEFGRVREETVARRDSAVLLVALSAGAATLVRTRGDGLEEWTVSALAPATGTEDTGTEDTGVVAGQDQLSVPRATATLLVPAAVGADGADGEARSAARIAALTGTCPACGRRSELVAGYMEVPHNSRCAARRAL